MEYCIKVSRFLILSFFPLLFCAQVMAQSVMSGTVFDRTMGNRVVDGVSVTLPDMNMGTSTDRNGRFMIRVQEPGEYRVRFTHVGYMPLDTLVRIPVEDLSIFLDPTTSELEQITITERSEPSPLQLQVPLSTVRLTAQQIASSPRVLGESDVLRVLQTLPGIKTESDYSGGLHVRGGRNDQNLILLDGIPVYNPWHFFGVFGAFNSDIIHSVEFNKGVFPALYGNRLSSLIHIETIDGSQDTDNYAIHLGLLSSSAAISSKLNERNSLSFSIRRTYMDPFLRMWDNHESYSDRDGESYQQRTQYYFMDANMRYRFQIDRIHTLQLTLFSGNDRLRLTGIDSYNRVSEQNTAHYDWLDEQNSTDFGWDNYAAGVRLTSNWDRIRLVQQLYYSRFVMNNDDYLYSESGWGRQIRTSAGLRPVTRTVNEDVIYFLDKSFGQSLADWGYNGVLTVPMLDWLRMDAGMELLVHDFRKDGLLEEYTDIRRNENVDGYPPKNIRTNIRVERLLEEDMVAYSGALSMALSLELGALSVYPGLRFESFEPGALRSLLPRVNTTLSFSENWIITAGYGQFRQYYHAVGLESFQLPVDNWVWSDADISPSKATTLTAGTRYQYPSNGSILLEGYYRTFEKLLNFDPIESYKAVSGTGTLVPVYTDIMTVGEGEAYGVEILLDHQWNKVSLQTGYTWSRSRLRFDRINEQQWYPARSDIRHDVNVQVQWNVSTSWEVGGNFAFRSGQPITWAYSAYDRVEDHLGLGIELDSDLLIWKYRNNFRLPDYHRLDVFVTRKGGRFFNGSIDYSFNVINLYNRQNIFAINPRTEFQLDRAVQTTFIEPRFRVIPQLPVLPMVSVKIYGGK